MQKRPFADEEEMNRVLIANYNSVVHKNDTVYLLGDICFRIGIDKANELIASLNGKKYLIKGNHDKKLLHGHIHSDGLYNLSNLEAGIKRYDVGVDANNYYPVSINKIENFFNSIMQEEGAL